MPQALGYQAQLLFLHDKPDEADAVVQKAFDLDPNFAFAYWLRGLMRLNEGEAVGALLLFRKTAELLDPNANQLQGEVHARIAELELHFNRPVAARAALERAIHLSPGVPELSEALDSVFGSKSRLPEAARKAYAFRQAPPGRAERWQPALEAAATGKLTDALRVFEALADADSDNPALAFNLGLVRAWLGDNPRAAEWLGRSIDSETDDAKAEEAGALCEVLRCGSGMENATDYLEYRATIEIRNPEAVGKMLSAWSDEHRLIVIETDREQGAISALVLEAVPDLGTGVTAPAARLMAYMFLHGNSIRIWHPNRASLEAVVNEIHSRAAEGISAPRFDTATAQFNDLLAEILLFPNRQDADPRDVQQRIRDAARQFFEETWLRRSLKSLDGPRLWMRPLIRKLRKRLPGLIRFLSNAETPRRSRGRRCESIFLRFRPVAAQTGRCRSGAS